MTRQRRRTARRLNVRTGTRNSLVVTPRRNPPPPKERLHGAHNPRMHMPNPGHQIEAYGNPVALEAIAQCGDALDAGSPSQVRAGHPAFMPGGDGDLPRLGVV